MRIPRGESGQATVFMALFMGLVMLGFLAFALDVGYLFHEKRVAQAAADAAAVAAAEEYSAGNSISSTQVTNAANVAATLNGFNTGAATNPAAIQLSTSSSGIYSSTLVPVPATWVTAQVSQPIPTFFLGAFSKGMKTVTVAATGVAACCVASSTCVCLTGGAGNDLAMSGNAHLNANACGVTVDSNSGNAITISGSASVCGTSVAAVSTNWYTTGNNGNINNAGYVCTTAKVVQGAAACANALVAPVKPAGLTGHCTDNPIKGWVLAANSLNGNNYNANYTLPFNGAYTALWSGPVPIPNDTVINGSACYTSFNLGNAAEVEFSPGTYYINGDFTVGGGEKIGGTGVTFVVTGNIYIANGVTLNLTAPTVDGQPGVLFYVTGNGTVSLAGGANSSFQGIIDAPNSAVTLNNGTGTSTSADFIANTLNMSGGATLTSYATPLLGGAAAAAGAGYLVQ